ncbi:MAG: hypothetical protein J6V78_02960 [Clostridia bacterium]|nr:hypothetical protein [Clostridia bacterium]
MVLFFCATPVQLYRVINIKEQYYKNKKCRLYIFDYFNDAERYVEKCRKTGIFEDVMLVKFFKISQRTNGLKYKNAKLFSGLQNCFFTILEKKPQIKNLYARAWGAFYCLLKNDVLERLKLEKTEKIEEIFFSYQDPIIRMIFLKLKNQKIEYNRFEDGTATYSDGVIFYKFRFDELLKISDEAFKPEKIFVHFPEAVKDIKETTGEIIRVDFSQNKRAKELLYDIFDIANIQEIKEKVIFFDTLVENQNMGAMLSSLNIFSEDELVCKKHPRRKDSYYEDKKIKVYDGASLPFEMYCEYFDVSDKILISHCSTACISPALFFKQTPVAVLCYDFATTKKDKKYDDFDEFLERLINNGVPLKLYKPRSEAEYQQLLSTLRQQ